MPAAEPAAVLRTATRADFDDIYAHLEAFWGSDRTRHLHHPMWIEHFGNSAFVIPDEHGSVAAYLFGFLSQTQPLGYVHLIAVRQDLPGPGVRAAAVCALHRLCP